MQTEFHYDMPKEKFHTILATQSLSTIGEGEGTMSASSLPANLLSICTRNVPFTNVWVQKIGDTAVANGPASI